METTNSDICYQSRNETSSVNVPCHRATLNVLCHHFQKLLDEELTLLPSSDLDSDGDEDQKELTKMHNATSRVKNLFKREHEE